MLHDYRPQTDTASAILARLLRTALGSLALAVVLLSACALAWL